MYHRGTFAFFFGYTKNVDCTSRLPSSMPVQQGSERVAAALFIVLNDLFRNGIGTSSKRRKEDDDVMFDALTLAAASELWSHRCDSSDSELYLKSATHNPLFVL